MTHEHPEIEITILSAADMQRYAQGALSGEEEQLAEGALLDDERARKLVLDTNAPQPEPLSAKSIKLIKDCARACEKAVVKYEDLSRNADSETVRKFAGVRFSERWKLLSDILRVTQRDTQKSLHISPASSEKPSSAEALRQAAKKDLALEQALESAFHASTAPKWKAKIAEWLAVLVYDKDRVAWLS